MSAIIVLIVTFIAGFFLVAYLDERKKNKLLSATNERLRDKWKELLEKYYKLAKGG